MGLFAEFAEDFYGYCIKKRHLAGDERVRFFKFGRAGAIAEDQARIGRITRFNSAITVIRAGCKRL